MTHLAALPAELYALQAAFAQPLGSERKEVGTQISIALRVSFRGRRSMHRHLKGGDTSGKGGTSSNERLGGEVFSRKGTVARLVTIPGWRLRRQFKKYCRAVGVLQYLLSRALKAMLPIDGLN